MFRLAQTNDNHYVTTMGLISDGTSNVIAVGEVSVSSNVHPMQTGRVFPLWAGGNNDWAGQWRISSWARVTGPELLHQQPLARVRRRAAGWSDQLVVSFRLQLRQPAPGRRNVRARRWFDAFPAGRNQCWDVRRSGCDQRRSIRGVAAVTAAVPRSVDVRLAAMLTGRLEGVFDEFHGSIDGWIFSVALLIGLAGCSGGQPTAKVSGKVTHDGQGVTGGIGHVRSRGLRQSAHVGGQGGRPAKSRPTAPTS